MGKGKSFDKKKKYMNNPQGFSRVFSELEHTQGFLVTCNESKERMAVRDVYNMLNDYLDEICEEKGIESHLNKETMLEKRKVSGDFEFPAKKMLKTDDNDTQAVDNEDDDIPVRKQSSESFVKKKVFVFKQMKLKAKGLLFIKMDDSWAEKVSAHEIAHRILEDVHTNQKQVSKFCHRLYPIQYTFDANFNTFKHFVEKILDEHFPNKNDLTDTNIGMTWNMHYRCRSNNKFDKQKFMSFFMEHLPNIYPQK